jgi:hypothetical protein
MQFISNHPYISIGIAITVTLTTVFILYNYSNSLVGIDMSTQTDPSTIPVTQTTDMAIQVNHSIITNDVAIQTDMAIPNSIPVIPIQTNNVAIQCDLNTDQIQTIMKTSKDLKINYFKLIEQNLNIYKDSAAFVENIIDNLKNPQLVMQSLLELHTNLESAGINLAEKIS